jgi:hypothetical protein
MEVSGESHAPAVSPAGKNLGTHRIGWVGPRVDLEVLKKRNASYPYPDAKPEPSSLVTIPTALPRLLTSNRNCQSSTFSSCDKFTHTPFRLLFGAEGGRRNQGFILYSQFGLLRYWMLLSPVWVSHPLQASHKCNTFKNVTYLEYIAYIQTWIKLKLPLCTPWKSIWE